jgi:hypothetical protein
MISLLVPVLLGPVAAHAAEGTIRNQGKGCWRLKPTYNSMGIQNPLKLQAVEEPGREVTGKENRIPLLADAGDPKGFPRLPTLQIGPKSFYTVAFEHPDRPVVQRFNLLDENRQTEGILEVTQTLEAGQGKIDVTFHGLPGREAIFNPAILAESDYLVIYHRSWSQAQDKARRGLSVPGASTRPSVRVPKGLASIPEDGPLPPETVPARE